MHVTTDDHGDGCPAGDALAVDVDAGQVLGVEAQLHVPPHQGRVHLVAIGFELNSGRLGHPADNRPAKGLEDRGRLRQAGGVAGEEHLDGSPLGLSVDAVVGDGLAPGLEPVVQLLEAPDAHGHGLGQEALPEVAVEAFQLSLGFGGVGLGEDQAGAEHRAGAGELVGPERRSVVHQQGLGHAPVDHRGAQHVLAGPGVLLRAPAAGHDQAAVIVQQAEQASPAAARHPGVGDEGPVAHVAAPQLVGP